MAIFTYALGGAISDAVRGGVLTIGNFDGVHLGHQALLAQARQQARTLGCPAVAVTFDPPPSQLLRPDLMQPPLTTLADRAVLLHQHGADHVLILQTSHEFLQLSARDFFERIVIDQLKTKAMVEGFNFGFGRNREGTIELLRQLCGGRNLLLTLIPPCEILGQPVSSSRVRAELLAGKVDIVSQLLGRAYRIAGVVGVGDRRGATLGFPTANLHEVETLLPGNGVYAVRAAIEGQAWPAAANIGPNPTFGENVRKVEVHVIGFSGDLYEKNLSVDFVKKIRDTRTFAGVAELTAQIRADIDVASREAQG
ncbi:MAG: riboflavin biosynthesis protein RibF [Planctomycetes bacterium]|nr:riboflavin biosynthesis protein RibF [Planctomycetota bacterium]